jgi:hypothetical protein
MSIDRTKDAAIYHEVGHAIAMRQCGWRVESLAVFFVPFCDETWTGDIQGHMAERGSVDNQKFVGFTGPFAELRFSASKSDDWSGDSMSLVFDDADDLSAFQKDVRAFLADPRGHSKRSRLSFRGMGKTFSYPFWVTGFETDFKYWKDPKDESVDPTLCKAS